MCVCVYVCVCVCVCVFMHACCVCNYSNIAKPHETVGRKTSTVPSHACTAHLTHVVSIQEDVPCCQVSVYKLLVGKVVHARGNLPGIVQEGRDHNLRVFQMVAEAEG